jgi:hypothetical protein
MLGSFDIGIKKCHSSYYCKKILYGVFSGYGMLKYMKIHLKIAPTPHKIAVLLKISISFPRRDLEFLLRVKICCWIWSNNKILIKKRHFCFLRQPFRITFLILISKCPSMRQKIIPFLPQMMNYKCPSKQNYKIQ